VLSALTAALAWFHAYSLPPEIERKAGSASDVRAKFWDVVRTFFQKKGLVFAVTVVALYRVTEGQLGRIVPLFLLDSAGAGGLGLSTTRFGTAYGTLAPCGFMIGTVVGGWMVSRMSLQRTLTAFCVMFNVPGMIYFVLALFPSQASRLLEVAVVGEQAAYGIGSVGLKLVMMQRLAAGPYATAHFAFAVGLSALSVTFGGMASGFLQASFGYTRFFVFVLTTSIPGIIAAYVYSQRKDDWA
jgi:MFS transporter, PAT family, beta-lactamase induction signal transducer AmpG